MQLVQLVFLFEADDFIASERILLLYHFCMGVFFHAFLQDTVNIF